MGFRGARAGAVFATACVLLSACGSTGGGSEAEDKGTPPTELADPLNASCGQIGFEIKRFPKATKEANFQVARKVAYEYRNTNSNDGELRTAFSVTLLGICNKTRDAQYRPVKQAREIAESARRLANDSGADFAQTLAVAAAGNVRGGEQESSDEAFVQRANQICGSRASGITPRVMKLTKPGAEPTEVAARKAHLDRWRNDKSRLNKHCFHTLGIGAWGRWRECSLPCMPKGSERFAGAVAFAWEQQHYGFGANCTRATEDAA